MAERLGLGAVDPLLLRLGVIVMIGVLLVPLAMSLRPDSSTGSVRTEVTAAPSTELVAPGESPSSTVAPAVDVPIRVDAGDARRVRPTAQSSDEPAAAPSTSPARSRRPSTEQPETTAERG